MIDPHAAHWKLLARVVSYLDGDDLYLIGGLAVHRTLADEERQAPLEFETTAEVLDHLPHLVRVTKDVDLCLSGELLATVASGLSRDGFVSARSAPPPATYRRGSERIDLIALPPAWEQRPSREGLQLASFVCALESEFVEARDLGPGVRVASPLALVLLKCVAYDNRHKPKDAIDLAGLALWDERGGEVRHHLPAAVDGLPAGLTRILRRVREDFSEAGHHAAGCLLPGLRNARLRDPEDWEVEYLVRGRVSRAVQTLFSGVCS